MTHEHLELVQPKSTMLSKFNPNIHLKFIDINNTYMSLVEAHYSTKFPVPYTICIDCTQESNLLCPDCEKAGADEHTFLALDDNLDVGRFSWGSERNDYLSTYYNPDKNILIVFYEPNSNSGVSHIMNMTKPDAKKFIHQELYKGKDKVIVWSKTDDITSGFTVYNNIDALRYLNKHPLEIYNTLKNLIILGLPDYKYTEVTNGIQTPFIAEIKQTWS